MKKLALAGVAVLAGLGLAMKTQAPELQRYRKIRSM
jgi:hypothetical protein